MKPRVSALVWVGFATVVLGLVSYLPLFARFPATRDFPWANLLLFAAGGALLGAGAARAFSRPAEFRGKVIGPLLGVVAMAACAFFVFGVFVGARQLPASTRAPRVGDPAPGFTLTDQDGRSVSLDSLVAGARGGAGPAALLIFYRGAW